MWGLVFHCLRCFFFYLLFFKHAGPTNCFCRHCQQKAQPKRLGKRLPFEHAGYTSTDLNFFVDMAKKSTT
jgi:hypothetical protein